MTSPILVTGVASFIGHATAHRLLARGERVIGVDIINDYYDLRLKEDRLRTLSNHTNFTFHRVDIIELELVKKLLQAHRITRVVQLAAQTGVPYSIENPFADEGSNLPGHLAINDACRHIEGFESFVYASSSSAYGERPIGSGKFSEDEPDLHPVPLYAVTKRSCGLMSEAYCTLYGFPQTGLRFFTVYNPWGRPDMAYFLFTQKSLLGEAIEVYGEGRMARDFTNYAAHATRGRDHHLCQYRSAQDNFWLQTQSHVGRWIKEIL